MLYWATVHQLERAGVGALPGLAADDPEGAHQPVVGVPQQEHVGAVIAIDRLRMALAVRGRVHFLRKRILQRPVQLGRVDAVVEPHRQAHAVVDRDGLRAGQQHLHDLPVRVERCCADRRRRVVQRHCRLHRRVLVRLAPDQYRRNLP
jgi:hypothetical protein